MVDRFWVWMSTGVVTAGVTAAVLAGAGVATATAGEANDGGVTKISESTDPPAEKDDSGAGSILPNGPDGKGEDEQGDDPAGDNPDPEEDVIDGDLTDEDATGEDGEAAEIGEDLTDGTTGEKLTDDGTFGEIGELGELVEPTKTGTGSDTNGVQTGNLQIAQGTQTVAGDFGVVAKAGEADVEIGESGGIGEIKETAPTDVVEEHAADLFGEASQQTETPQLTSVAFAAPAAARVNAMASASPLNVVLDIIGTIVFGLYNFLTRTVGGPPGLPPGSTVTVHSSRLRIDCGCAPGEGQEVPVDWYIPQDLDEENPRLIYLQHGFLAAGPWYSYTAAALAEETNSIVVAPSITSNFLSYDQCWLGGAPMHQAMADLFIDGNTALAESLAATDYDEELKWNEVVLMGHSLGGGAVSGIAGYMTENGSIDRLAGVVLLDGVGLNGEMANDLRKVVAYDPDLPIYQLAAPKYMWNAFGSGTDALVQARPNADFYGVTLVGGSHVDAMRGGNVLIQFSQQLVSGFSTPQNVEAARMIMVGWVNDMFTGERNSDYYLERGETLTIETPAGQATLVDLPNALRKPFLLNFVEPVMASSTGLFTIQPGCLRESIGNTASCTQSTAA